MRWIYISPHLDDAVLSAGGLIYQHKQAGEEVEIWTIMSGFPPQADLSPFARALHAEWGMSTAEAVVQSRRAEDVEAVGRVGAKPVHFDFLDCIYRRGLNGEWLYADVFVPPHEGDKHLPVRIAEPLASRLRPGDHLVCQLALGSHVDHVLVRRAVELLDRRLFYDADIPYHFNFPEELAQKTGGMRACVHPVTEAGLKSWQEAIAAYDSQVGMLFENSEKMREKIARYLSENKGICLWSSVEG